MSESVTLSVDYDHPDHSQEEQSRPEYERRLSDHQPVQVQETPREQVDPGANPTLAVVQDLLKYLIQQKGETNTSSRSTPQPDFLQMVTMMKRLGTNHFEGGTDPFDGDSWLEDLEKKFSATRCPDEFKKDVAVYYLEKDAMAWWKSI